MYDLIIIGGGPAGVSAGIYAARKKIKFLLITESFGGQSAVASEIQNWVGTKSISGFDLAKKMEDHLMSQEGVEVEEGSPVEKVEKEKGGFKIILKNGKEFEARTILAASGGRRRRLGIPSEKEFENKGVAYCSTCDAPLFAKKTVAIVGGGNAALGAVKDLTAYADKVYLMVRGESIKGDPVLFEEIKKDKKAEILFNAEITEIFGDASSGGFVSGVKYSDKKSGKIKELKLEGIFVEIGSVPNSEFLGGLVNKDGYGDVIVDHGSQKTSHTGIWAAGDITNLPYRQNIISASDGVKAVLSISDHLKTGK